MIVSEVIGGFNEETTNTVLANFVPQYHYSINTVMRYVVGSRSTVSAWRSYSTKINKQQISFYTIEIWGNILRMMCPVNVIINEYPDYIGYGKDIAILVDYRLFLGIRRYHMFYRKVSEELAQDVEDDVELVDKRTPRYGLIGFGPRGLFALQTDHRERVVREEASSIGLFREYVIDSKLSRSIREFDSRCGSDIRVSFYIYFPSVFEASVFSNIVFKSIKGLVNELRVVDELDEVIGIENSRSSIADLLYRHDIIVALTTDPLPLLSPVEKLLSRIELRDVIERFFIVHYIGLYFNLANHYYEVLYRSVEKLGDLGRGNQYIGVRDYLEGSSRIPLLALATPDKADSTIMLKSFHEVLPIVAMDSDGRRTRFKVLSPDIVVTTYDRVIEFFKILSTSIIKHVEVNVKITSLNGRNAENTVINDIGNYIVHELIRLAKENARSKGRVSRWIHKNVVYVDDLRRVPE